MKRLTFSFLMVAAMSSIILFSSCSKEGPAGPAGATGATGPTGATGATGPAGTANVIYSEWLINDFEELKDDDDELVGYGLALEAPKLTADILSSGELKVYVNIGSDAEPTVFPLPYNDGQIYIDVVFRLNTIIITSNADLSDAPIRYILIPGGTAARKAGPTTEVDWNDYTAVKTYLGLRD